jgi:beta-galactosidase
MRNMQSLGSSWRFLPRFEEAFVASDHPLGDWEEVDLPHANLELPYNAFDERSYQFVSAYARDFELAGPSAAKRVFLDFEAVMTACEVWVNGEKAGSHVGGYTPFTLDVSGLVREGRNRLVLRVDSTERADIPPFGHVIDYLCYGGIYRGAFLRVQDAAFIADSFARPEVAVGPDGVARATGVEVDVEVDARDVDVGDFELAIRLREPGAAGEGGAIIAEARSAIDPSGRDRLSIALSPEAASRIRLWDVDMPAGAAALYELDTILLAKGAEVDAVSRRIGFRAAEWRPEGFFLNGRPLKLRGLNRHQSWPYAGYAMPARAQRRDAEVLKRELGLNLVRTSHYPQAPAFLDACDELGLLVFEEFPGWQHIGDAAWKDVACGGLEEMIRRDRNRPSVVLWGVRINESPDDHDFYARTNEIARRLDPSRARGGVRCFEGSELLEDVYTMNDFVHNGAAGPLRAPRKVTRLSRDVPYLVTEHNGHMFPTKRFDNEERLREHALRHARVLDAALGSRGVAGAIGWCAFDYNTHKDFGSGDRICYHGVSDMFRLPKYAAALYASQKDPSEGVVLEAASLFSKGERSAAVVLPIEVYTNCDEICLWRAGNKVGVFRPDRASFPNLPHPPVAIGDFIGDQLAGSGFPARDQALLKRLAGKILSIGFDNITWRDKLWIGVFLKRNRLTMAEGTELFNKFGLVWGAKDESWEIVGYVGGREVARRSYGGDAVPARLAIRADAADLSTRHGERYGEDWDCCRVDLGLLDQYGNLSPFASECAEIEVEGPGRVIGPRRVALAGGCIAFWLRTTGQPGLIRVRARGTRLDSDWIEIRVL